MRWQAPVVFFSLSCDRSQHRHDISFIGSSEKIVFTVSHAYVVHLLDSIHSGAGAMLYVFEVSEAVIKKIIKGRSPRTRHVSRTHRVALDRLFDRINLDPKIQIRHIDIVTKGYFTRDEWNNLLRLFIISHFSSLRCTKSFSLIGCTTMAKRIQDQKDGERLYPSRHQQ